MLHALGGGDAGFVGPSHGHTLFFQQGRVHRHHIFLGVHEGVGDHDGHNDQSHNDQVVRLQYRLRNRHRTGEDAVGGFGEGLAGSGHGQGDRTRKTRMPHHKAAVGRSYQQSIVHTAQAAGNLFGKNDAYDKAETPVEPTSNGGNTRNKGNGRWRCFRYACQSTDAPFDSRGCCQCGSANQHQGHLHGKSQQIPHATAPMFDDLDGGLMADRHGQTGGHKGEDDCKNERFGQPTLHQLDTEFNHSFVSLGVKLLNIRQG